MFENGHIGDLAGPYAVGACSPDETAAVAEHVTTCPACAAEIDTLSRTAEWIGASAARRPAPALRSRVLTAALAARPARLTEARRLSDVYAAQVAELDTLLAALSADQWRRPSKPHPTVTALMVHLSGNDRLVAAAAGIGGPHAGAGAARWNGRGADPASAGPRHTHGDDAEPPQAGMPRTRGDDAEPLEAGTSPAHGRGGIPVGGGASDVRKEWRTQAGAIIAALSHADAGLLGREVRLAGRRALRRPMREAMIQRGFETWIHAEDVRAVLDLPPQRPNGRQTADIVGFALALLPAAMRAAGHRGAVHLSLTGEGGRDHLVGEGVAVAEVSMPADRFCRLLAGRLQPEVAGAAVSGDAAAANGLLTVASTMGCE
ncbi:zf-HC2 domain-containing protein [Actinoplanes sp. NPDC023714]|uniref:zf-HC2 domain-containing protein n=1 Tax=Actinoplanes sp. NPDC023714 TaxID=3154322 RepID=UPI0033D0B2F6